MIGRSLKKTKMWIGAEDSLELWEYIGGLRKVVIRLKLYTKV